MRIAVCEDEKLAMDALVSKIQAYMDTKQRKCAILKFPDGESLLSDMQKSRSSFDAVYLDINMNRINGIDTAKAIRKTDSKTFIVFVTALKEYVFDAFDVEAANYLLKPIDNSKLFSTLDKLSRHSDAEAGQSLVINRGVDMEKVPFENIAYCEVLNHRIFVYEKDCMHECSGKIDALEKELNVNFFRCHRSYIVNLRFVERYKDGFAYLSSKEKIPVATRRRQAFMQALLRFQRDEVR